MPDVSIIIPVFNAEKYLIETIEGVLSQTFKDWEIIIINDGSSDGSLCIAESFVRSHGHAIKVLSTPDGKNLGSSMARNIGLMNSSGRYLLFLDSDDVLLPEMIERHFGILETEPISTIMSFGPARRWSSWSPSTRNCDSTQEFDFCMPNTGIVPAKVLLKGILKNCDNAPVPSGTLIRREAIVKANGWEEKFKGMYDDHAFYTKMLLGSANVFVVKEVLFFYRKHPDSLTAKNNFYPQIIFDRMRFIDWLWRYSKNIKAVDPDLLATISKERWLYKLNVFKIRLFGPETARNGILPGKLRRLFWKCFELKSRIRTNFRDRSR